MTSDATIAPAPRGAGEVSSLAESLDAPRRALETEHGGHLAYYSDASGDGRPLLLLHSINAAPSSFEVRPLFEHYRGQRPVYSLDLPGFGHSDRSDRRYSPALFGGAIAEFLERVVGAPADLIALSLSGEFASRAAMAVPQRVASLVLISPTGFSGRGLPSAGTARGIHRMLTLPGLAQGLYNLVASRPSIRHYLGKSFIGTPPAEMIDYAYATSHQPGARHAPLYFLSTQLFTPHAIDQLYGRLVDLPVLVIADRDPYVGFDELVGFVAAHPSWQRKSLAPHMGLPHWERLAETTQVLDAFWAQA